LRPLRRGPRLAFDQHDCDIRPSSAPRPMPSPPIARIESALGCKNAGGINEYKLRAIHDGNAAQQRPRRLHLVGQRFADLWFRTSALTSGRFLPTLGAPISATNPPARLRLSALRGNAFTRVGLPRGKCKAPATRFRSLAIAAVGFDAQRGVRHRGGSCLLGGRVSSGQTPRPAPSRARLDADAEFRIMVRDPCARPHDRPGVGSPPRLRPLLQGRFFESRRRAAGRPVACVRSTARSTRARPRPDIHRQ